MVERIVPPLLPERTRVGIVSVGADEPARFPDQFEAGLERLRSSGFEITEAPHVRKTDGYQCANPHIVATEFNSLWKRTDVDAVLCAGGGSLANALLPFLDFELFRTQPKPLIGASNPTVLLNAISQTSGIVTFHGPSVIWDFGDADQPKESFERFSAVLRHGADDLGIVPRFLRPADASGPLLGGNLGSLLDLAGTKWWPDFRGALLLWEEVGEDAASIAAKLSHLAQLGVFDQIAGMIVGELVECDGSGDPSDAVLDVTAGWNFPIAWGLPFGHTVLKMTLPIGRPVALRVADGSLRVAAGSQR